MRNKLDACLQAVNQVVLGKAPQVQLAMACLLARGHLLIEDLPGMGKTTLSHTLAKVLGLSFQRIQFTSDLLPGDILGTSVFDKESGQFTFHPGPIFAELVLADEINRAPAKVQAALLEAMEERQVTTAGMHHALPELFLVMATQNPIEQEGTYCLPEAQLDRFLLHLKVDYPDAASEQEMLRVVREERYGLKPAAQTVKKLPQATLLAARAEVGQVHVSASIERYILDLVRATRHAHRYDARLGLQIARGVSPRGTLGLEQVARAKAWMRGADFVTPDDVRAVTLRVLRHRIGLSYQAQAEGIAADDVLKQLLQWVAVA